MFNRVKNTIRNRHKRANRLEYDALETRKLCAADLTPAIIDAPTSAGPGALISVYADVDNIGTSASGTYRIDFRISNNTAIDNSDRLLKTVFRNSIAAGGDARWYEQITMPTDIAAGDHYVGAVVDPLNSIPEIREYNNSRADTNRLAYYATELSGQVKHPINNVWHSVKIRPISAGSNIVADRATWIVIHGRNSSPDSSSISQLAGRIEGYQAGDQVLTLDWRNAAASGAVGGAGEDFIKPVASWASTALSAYGFIGSRLNLVGHSWGSYVAAETAESFVEVNSILAIDPATNYPGGSYDPEQSGEVNFARNSRFSWAFFESGGDIFGSSITPLTADESIVITGSNHSASANVVASLISLGSANPVGSHFQLSRLLFAIPNSSWSKNRYNNAGTRTDYGGWYEAVIAATTNGLGVNSLRYFDAVTFTERVRYA